jgi:ComF family protein
MKINVKDLWERILFYVSVPTCVCCKTRLKITESALCESCIEKREKMKFRSCSRCNKKLDKCICSNEYLESHYVRRLAKCFRYMQREDTLPLNAPIYSLKRHHRKDVLEFCAEEMTKSIKNAFPKAKDYIVTNVPRSNNSIIKYGYDHAEMLAHEVAKRIGAKYEKILKSDIKVEQKKLHGESRKQNAKLAVMNEIDLSGKTVLIIDDIVTSGASMGEAAMLIRSLGAKRIMGAALGIAYKDKYTPFPHNTSELYTYW